MQPRSFSSIIQVCYTPTPMLAHNKLTHGPHNEKGSRHRLQSHTWSCVNTQVVASDPGCLRLGCLCAVPQSAAAGYVWVSVDVHKLPAATCIAATPVAFAPCLLCCVGQMQQAACRLAAPESAHNYVAVAVCCARVVLNVATSVPGSCCKMMVLPSVSSRC